MTNVKAALAATAIALVVVGTIAFTSKKPTVTSTYYFDESIGSTRGPITPGIQVLIHSEIVTAANWITTAQMGGSGSCLNSITFDQESGDRSDGIADGQYSLQEAINAVWAEYVSGLQFDLPTSGNDFVPPVAGASAITIGRASCP